MQTDQQLAALVALEEELRQHRAWLDTAMATIREAGVSNYPVVIAHQHETLPIGVAVLSGFEAIQRWKYRTTTLEELVHKQIVPMSKVDIFRNVYRDHGQCLCVFALGADRIGRWVFVPKTGEIEAQADF